MSNISRSKGNQTMKSDQLIKYNMKNILSKNYTQVMLSISLDQQSEML